jgi:hypothetical protein
MPKRGDKTKPHSQIRANKRIGDPASKYGYEPWKLDEDIQNKKAAAEQFKRALEAVLYKEYKYQDGTIMSDENKRQVLQEAHLEFIKRKGMMEGLGGQAYI